MMKRTILVMTKKDSKSDYDSVLDLEKYVGIPSELLTRAESLKLTEERFMVDWEKRHTRTRYGRS